MAVNNGAFYSQTQGLKLSTNSTNRVIVSTAGTTTFTGITSGSTLIDIRGTSGQLMSVTDTLTGALLTVNDNIGRSIFQVNSNSSIIGGSANTNTFVISGTNVGIGTASPTAKLHVGNATSFLKVTNDWFTAFGGAGGTWLDLSTDGPSGIGSGGPGINPWIAYASSSGLWFTDASAGDIAYRNTGGKLLFGNTGGNAGMSLSSDFLGIGTVSPSNKLHVYAATDPIKVEGVQTSTDTELLTIDGDGVVHKISVSSVGGAFLRNETNPSATDTIAINQSIFNPSNLTVLSTSTFIVDTNADYYVLGDFYNSGSTIVNGTLKVGGTIYNSGTITGSGIIE
jgi:hypothetical protein